MSQKNSKTVLAWKNIVEKTIPKMLHFIYFLNFYTSSYLFPKLMSQKNTVPIVFVFNLKTSSTFFQICWKVLIRFFHKNTSENWKKNSSKYILFQQDLFKDKSTSKVPFIFCYMFIIPRTILNSFPKKVQKQSYHRKMLLRNNTNKILFDFFRNRTWVLKKGQNTWTFFKDKSGGKVSFWEKVEFSMSFSHFWIFLRPKFGVLHI